MKLATRFAARSPQLQSDTPLSEAQMQAVAPSIFAIDKHASRSPRYTYIPTIEVLRALAREGFAPYMVAQCRTRDESHREFTKHLVRLRHAEVRVGREANELILLNSHNGTSSYQMLAGVFRFVCKNGLITGRITENLRAPHTGAVVDRVIEGAYRVLEDFDTVDASRHAMQALSLAPEQQQAFARAALSLRYETSEGGPAAPITEAQVNAPRRAEDSGNDLWSTLNRVQENLVRGGLAGRSARGRRQRTRALTGIDADVRLNRALWTLAEEMRRLAA